ncbi:thiosulfate sulfurtransferase PspE precursor [Methanobrevibacter cuticularis]|uniref:Thiosulfate sulfurtransferase PspE n=1 Tax=Methanobrevibacter cuticularis TaxID=47311 RepID=A0A166CKJ9_9EURY|nr:rhodanese-like domain-containing protein [Methanobrevibacter cuticularis]KZX14606.1 thiosulfate sulfurtransferase PspE precursor [Methanobrevibacter cuticularis]
MKYQNISPEELEIKLKENNPIFLVDVRSKEEYDERHIPNSILIPLDNISHDITDQVKDKSEKLFLYCRSGRRSKLAAEKLADTGYNNIYLLEGGLNNWKYEIE